MKNFYYKLQYYFGIPLLAFGLFIACKGEAKETEQVGDFKIELLFEKDGCKMYRFKDGKRYVYWSDCRGTTSYEITSLKGKSSGNQMSITTAPPNLK
ncbi:Probable lipoprotein precursor [Tenacibaculum litopenaei]|jgi:hypothetical protein|uniref:hypothetical protein n=1 Tax=Tenacibaculum litopenaei TaxID=396016 RepID=UPI003894C916